MSDQNYFVRIRGKVSGPFDLAMLQKLVRRGMLSRAHHISSDRATWSQAGEFVDLFPGSGGRDTPAEESPSETELAVAEDAHDVVGYVEPEPLPSAPPTYAAQPPTSPYYSAAHPADVAPQGYYQALPPGPVYRGAPEASHRGMAIASMVLALVGLFCLGFITGPLAIIFAGVALSGMSRTGNRGGHGMALTGLIIGIIDVAWEIFTIMMWGSMFAASVAGH